MELALLTGLGLGTFLLILGGYYGYTAWKELRPGHMKAELVDEELNARVHIVKVSPDERGKDVFHVQGMPYFVVPDKLYKFGRFRMPKAYYIKGNPNPRDMRKAVHPPDERSAEFQEAVETHVFRDMMEAFKKPFLTPEMSFSLLLFAILGGIGFVWWDLSGTINEIAQATGAVSEAASNSGARNSSPGNGG